MLPVRTLKELASFGFWLSLGQMVMMWLDSLKS